MIKGDSYCDGDQTYLDTTTIQECINKCLVSVRDLLKYFDRLLHKGQWRKRYHYARGWGLLVHYWGNYGLC